MIAIDPPVRFLDFSLASKGPSTHGTEGMHPQGVHPFVRHRSAEHTAFGGIQVTREENQRQISKLRHCPARRTVLHWPHRPIKTPPDARIAGAGARA